MGQVTCITLVIFAVLVTLSICVLIPSGVLAFQYWIRKRIKTRSADGPKMTDVQDSVIIVGAGLAGLVAAYELTRKKIPVTIVD